MKRFKRHKDYGFLDQDIRLSKLNQLGDPLENSLTGGTFFRIYGKQHERDVHQLYRNKASHRHYRVNELDLQYVS